jgi:two-component system cell cycle response regulator
MTARILVVDDMIANVKLLEARLSAEYFDVRVAMNGPDALEIAGCGEIDLVLLDVMMPGMDGFEVCRRLKQNPLTAHIPVVMVTALDQPSDRVRGLDAGADDFLTKPVNEVALIARVRSLVRLKGVMDELRARALASKDIGIGDPLVAAAAETGLGGRILLIEDRLSTADRLVASLKPFHTLDVETDAQRAVFRAAEKPYDLLVISLDLEGQDGLRIVAQMRSLERTRHVAVLMLAEADETGRIMRGLDLGANDYLTRPIDRNELLARVRTQVRRQRYAERLRNSVQASMEAAITDALTGLHNRRYVDANLSGLVEDAARRSRPLAVMIMDIDRFKSVNDTYGHDVGDEVLREVARRIKECTRSQDLLARFGGEEMIAVLPESNMASALQVAERIRERVEREPFAFANGTRSLRITLSIGLAVMRHVAEKPADLFRRADEALYRAKNAGRNRVIPDAA